MVVFDQNRHSRKVHANNLDADICNHSFLKLTSQFSRHVADRNGLMMISENELHTGYWRGFTCRGITSHSAHISALAF